MARKIKRTPQPTEVTKAALSLSNRAGEPLVVFPESVVQPLRRMVTLLDANKTLPPRLALVAALREEGVTYTSLALATTLAYDTASTLCLVELNWEAPGLARLLSAGAAPAADPGGLAAVLDGRTTMERVWVETHLPNLTLLPAGEIPRERREAVARSARLRQSIETLAERFDHLVLDVPAVARTSAAIPLAHLADASLLVIRQGVTPRQVVASALDDLQTGSILGVVLNRARWATPSRILDLIPRE